MEHEVPEVDIEEQRRSVVDDAVPDWAVPQRPMLDPEVPEADAVEQSMPVPMDDDDRR